LVFNDVPTPTIASDEILVRIRSTAVNHLDLVETSGTARQILPIDLPWIVGPRFDMEALDPSAEELLLPAVEHP
jgi:NADPH:quinone reductase-like Zn-dependent oxidoreductase